MVTLNDAAGESRAGVPAMEGALLPEGVPGIVCFCRCGDDDECVALGYQSRKRAPGGRRVGQNHTETRHKQPLRRSTSRLPDRKWLDGLIQSYV